jgi:hypothetical protein
VLTLAKDACQTAGPLSNKVARFEVLVTDGLTKAMIHVQTNQPSTYRRLYLGKRVIDSAFWGLHQGVPVLFTRTFHVSESDSGAPLVTVSRLDRPGGCPGGETAIFLGHTDAIQRHYDDHPDVFKGDFTEAIETLIELQAVATPEAVGGEVDLISLTKDGPRWVQKRGRVLRL